MLSNYVNMNRENKVKKKKAHAMAHKYKINK